MKKNILREMRCNRRKISGKKTDSKLLWVTKIHCYRCRQVIISVVSVYHFVSQSFCLFRGEPCRPPDCYHVKKRAAEEEAGNRVQDNAAGPWYIRGGLFLSKIVQTFIRQRDKQVIWSVYCCFLKFDLICLRLICVHFKYISICVFET